MRIAVYTLTRDRLEYTKHCFSTLNDKAGYAFDHFVLDNGSIDGTVEWLKSNEKKFKKVIYCSENVGISKGVNALLDEMNGYDLLIKMDNDCEIVTPRILDKIVSIYENIGKFRGKYILSPHVDGINNQPTRGRNEGISGYTIGLTAIIGGLFQIVPSEIFNEYRFDENLPKAKGQDDTFCDWFKKNGGNVGYIEELKVNHYETTKGQCDRFPEYFNRKWSEEI